MADEGAHTNRGEHRGYAWRPKDVLKPESKNEMAEMDLPGTP